MIPPIELHLIVSRQTAKVTAGGYHCVEHLFRIQALVPRVRCEAGLNERITPSRPILAQPFMLADSRLSRKSSSTWRLAAVRSGEALYLAHD